MIRAILVLILGVNMSFSVFGQIQNDSITIKKMFGGCKFEQNGKSLSFNKMLEQMRSNPEAYNYMNRASGNAGIATLFSYAGGFLVGWPVGTALGGGKPNWSLAGIGGALICITIPISNSINKNTEKAVAIYNGTVKAQTTNTSMDIKFKVKSDGMAFVINF